MSITAVRGGGAGPTVTGITAKPRAGRAAALLGPAALALAVAVPVADRGGFTADSRLLFVALAAFALSIALWRDERGVLSFAREPIVLCLLGLGLLTGLSAAWTAGSAADALRWALVIAAMAALAVAAAAASRERGTAALIVPLCALAAAEAVLGLAFAGARAEPFAERLGGAWRPGGTFEYAPALALLQVAALPALLRSMASARRRPAIAAAAAAAIAGSVIALAGVRAEAALAALVGAVAVAAPERTVGARWPVALGAAAVPACAGVAARFAAGGYAWPGATGGDAPRLVALAAVPLALAFAWAAARPVLGRLRARPRPRRMPRLATATLAAFALIGCGTAALAASAGSGGPYTEPASGFTHGRAAEWEAALDTALDRPLTGAGGDAYLVASRRHQGQAVARYAHSLPLEAWAELGPLGLALVLALYGVAARLVWGIRRHPDAWLAAPAVVAFLLANLVDWPWHLAGSAAAWALALGACLACRRGPRDRGRPETETPARAREIGPTPRARAA